MSMAKWVGQANCAAPDVDPEWFEPLPPGGHNARPENHPRISKALAVCQGCPIIAECRDLPRTSKYRLHGVFGGEYVDTSTARRDYRKYRKDSRLCYRERHILPEGATKCRECYQDSRPRAEAPRPFWAQGTIAPLPAGSPRSTSPERIRL